MRTAIVAGQNAVGCREKCDVLTVYANRSPRIFLAQNVGVDGNGPARIQLFYFLVAQRPGACDSWLTTLYSRGFYEGLLAGDTGYCIVPQVRRTRTEYTLLDKRVGEILDLFFKTQARSEGLCRRLNSDMFAWFS